MYKQWWPIDWENVCNFILDSFMLTLFMEDKNLYFNCFIITLVKFISDHIMLGFCAFMRVFLSPFITKVTFIYTPVCLYI